MTTAPAPIDRERLYAAVLRKLLALNATEHARGSSPTDSQRAAAAVDATINALAAPMIWTDETTDHECTFEITCRSSPDFFGVFIGETEITDELDEDVINRFDDEHREIVRKQRAIADAEDAADARNLASESRVA